MERTQHIATGIQGIKGNEILAMIQQTKEGTMVAVKPLCAALKIEWARQADKIQNDPRFSCVHMYMTATDGKQYQMICLPAEQVPMWINSINSNKVAEEKRAALLELHKFFGYALNEFSRNRYVTSEQHEADLRELRQQLLSAQKTIEQLAEIVLRQDAELHALRKAEEHRATAASHQMHAAKRSKHLRLMN